MAMLLVDLPGYGFAYASPEQAEKWKALMESYILDRGNPLKRVLFLVDARHGMKKADIDFLETLQASLYEKRSGPGSKVSDHQNRSERRSQSIDLVYSHQQLPSQLKRELPPIQIVLTKCDLVNQSDLARRVVLVRRQLSDCLIREPSALPIMMVSAKVEGQRGVVELQKELAALVPLSKDKPLLPVSNQSAEKQTIGRASQK
jgi:GTP-binding protein